MEDQKRLVHLPKENPASKPNLRMADQESTRLLSIFPLEIWLPIFVKIFLPEDLHHLEKSSNFFSNLLQKTKILFPEVIKLFSVKFTSKHNKIAPDLLSCRLVCRTWHIGVDSFLQSSSNYSKLLKAEPRYGNIIIQPKPTDTQFLNPEHAEAFLQHFDEEYAATHRNPLISRSVYMYYDPNIDQDPMSFKEKLLQVLKAYGHNVWELGLQFIFDTDPFTPTNIWSYNILRDFLQLTPNLKVFKFGCFEIGFPSDDEWNALKLSLESCAFPELKSLRHLQMSNVPTPVFDALLRKYSHVSMMSTQASDVYATSDLLMYKHPMPNLDQVAIYLSDYNKLIQLDTLNALWPLKTLIIRLDLHRGWNLQQLFRVLETRWAATLTELKINFPMHCSNQVLPSLHLPNLKLFWLESTICVSLDFILPMRTSLERLVIRYCRSGHSNTQLKYLYENEGEIKFYKFRNNLMDSNIWQLFPKLNIVDFCHL